MAFRFLETGPLVDEELELVAPDARWVEPLLNACAHPQSASDPGAAATTHGRVMDFLKLAPAGRQAEDHTAGRVPSYHFWMRLCPLQTGATSAGRVLPRWGEGSPPIEIAGGISLRVGNSPDLEMYGGHIGYNVYPPVRGNHYAERACRLLLPLAREHGLRRIWITCNPDNFASRRTCERLGCRFAEIVPVPREHPLYQRGDMEKCRYWLDL